jgi:outer membrane usher protein
VKKHISAQAATCLGVAAGIMAHSPVAQAQAADASKALFEQAFAQRRKTTVQQIALPTTLDGRELGVIDAQIRADGVWVSRETLSKMLKNILNSDAAAALFVATPPGDWISTATLQTLGIDAEYSSQSITLEVKIPLSLRRLQVLTVDGRSYQLADPDSPNAENTISPEYWSLIANTRWVVTQTATDAGALNTGRTYLDGAQRLGNWVLEAAGSVPLGSKSGASSRDLTRLVRDWPQQAVRLALGDMTSSSRPGMPSVSMAGLQLSRRFNLNPGLNPQSQPGERLSLPAGAAVDVRSNGFLTRTLQLAPGVYELRDIPVFTGANEVELSVVEPGGRVSFRRFDYFFDASLLSPGLSEFDVAVGQPSQAAAGGLSYLAAQQVASVSWRQGLLANVTGGAAAQTRKDNFGSARVIQTDGLWATPWGTALAYVTRNQHPTFSGQSESLQWRWQSAARPADTGGSWSWSTVAQTTRRGQGHSVLSSNTPSGASRDNGIRLSALTPGGLSTSISAAQRSGNLAADNSKTLGLSLRQSLDRRWSLEATLGRQQDPLRINHFFSVSLRFSGERQADGTAIRASAGYQSQDRRLQTDAEATGITTVAGADAPWRVMAGTGHGDSGKEASLRGALVTSRADLAALMIDNRTPGGWSRLTQASFASALVASPGGWGITRPVSDSAALVVPRPGYEKLSIYVDPMLDRSAAASDRFGAPMLHDLNAYTPRVIQLDVANLPPGRGLGVDRPLLLPTYRSVSIVPLGSNANVQYSGKLLNDAGQPAALVALRLTPVGKGEPVELFTSRRGLFTSPPLPPGRYWLTMPGEAQPLKQLQINDGEAGLIDLGTLTMPGSRP